MHCDCSELEKLQTADNIKAPEAAQIREALQDILGGGDEVSQRSSPNHRNLLPHSTPHTDSHGIHAAWPTWAH